MRFIKISSIIIFLICLTGCVQTQVLERLAIITARGIDVLEDDKLEKTVNLIRFDSDQESPYTTLSGTGGTLKGARKEISNQVGYQLSEGQLTLELYGKEAAKQGITRYFTGAIRDSRTADTMHLAVADRTAKEIFEANSEEAKNIGQFLDFLLENESKNGGIPLSTIQDFSRTAGKMGQDGVLPLIGLQEEIPSLIGLAIFQDDRHVMDISLNEAMLINFYLKKLDEVHAELKLPKEPFQDWIGRKNFLYKKKRHNGNNEFTIHFLIVDGKSKTKLKDKETLSFQTDVKMDIDLLEITEPIVIDKREIAETFEKEIEKVYKKQFEDLLEKIQEVNADPFGYGKIYRIHTKNGILKEADWRDKFPNISVDFNIDVNLMHTGTIQ